MRRIVFSVSAFVALFASLFMTGCSGSSSTAGSGGGNGGGGTGSTGVTVSPASVNFNTQAVNTTSSSQTVTFTNNTGAALIVSNFAVDDADSGFFPISSTGTCTPSLRVNDGASCTVILSFKPTPAQTYTGTLSFNDNISTTPLTVPLTGTGTSTVATASLSDTSIYFGSVAPSTSTTAAPVTLTNIGGATLNISSVAITGTNASVFTLSNNTCGTTLAAGSSCTITVAFTPTAANTSYNAAVTITDNSSTGTTQTISLSGLGQSSGSSGGTTTGTLYTFPESDNSVTPLYALVNGAAHTIDMTMYALQDSTFLSDLESACGRGVKVRVVLDASLEKSSNTSAYTSLNGTTNCAAVWSNTAFQATHQKSFIIDGTTVAIMSLNLQSKYYSTTRDFAFVETDAADIAAVQATFNTDYASGTASGGTQPACTSTTCLSYTPSTGDDLIWSPTTAKAEMTSIIANAQHTLEVENEEMSSSASYIISALEAACQRGVVVKIAMVDQSSYDSSFTALKNAGCGVHLYQDTTTGFYIHAKAVVADYGTSTQKVYMGSINYSNASMTENRELGLYITDSTAITTLETTMTADYAGGTPY